MKEFDPTNLTNENQASNFDKQVSDSKSSNLMYIEDYRNNLETKFKKSEQKTLPKTIGSSALNILGFRPGPESVSNSLDINGSHAETYHTAVSFSSMSLIEGGAQREFADGDSTDGGDKEKELIKVNELIDQLYALNEGKKVHFFGEDNYDSRILASSMNMLKINLPLGFNYDSDNILTAPNGDKLEVINSPSAIDHVRTSDKYKQDAQEALSYNFYNGKSAELALLDKEVPKSEEESKQINRIIALANKARQKLGLQKRLIDSRIVHFFNKEDWFSGGRGNGGAWHSTRQSIDAVKPENKLALLNLIGHESQHLVDVNSVSYGENNQNTFKDIRTGFSMSKDDKDCFGSIREAIAEERFRQLAKSELDGNLYYADEMARFEKLKAEHKNARYVYIDGRGKKIVGEKMFRKDGALAAYMNNNGEIKAVADGYIKERRGYSKLVDKLAGYSKCDRSELTDMFEIGAIKGDWLPVARVMHQTLGKGSFRKLAESSETAADLESFNRKLGLMYVSARAKRFFGGFSANKSKDIQRPSIAEKIRQAFEKIPFGKSDNKNESDVSPKRFGRKFGFANIFNKVK